MSAILASGPTLALAWKEWREQRPSVLAGLSLAILLPVILLTSTASSARPLGASGVAELLPGIYLLFLWPIFATAAGAATISNEISDGTLAFLLSRPISRRRVWLVKVVIAFCSALMVLAGSMTVAWCARLIAGGAAATGAPFIPDGLSSWEGWTLALTSSLLLFAAAVFCSAIFARAMTAAAAALAATMLIIAGLYTLWASLDLQPGLAMFWAFLDVGLVALLTLLASLCLFSWGEMLRGRGMRRLLMMSALAVAGTSSVVAIPVVQWYSRLTPANASVLDRILSPTGDVVAMTVTNLDRPSPQIWLVPSDGSGLERLTGAGAYNPGVSADGRNIAYLSSGGLFGWSSSKLDLRIVRANGTGDRRLAALPAGGTHDSWSGRVSFSPDGRRVAALVGTKLVIARDISGGGGPETRVDLVARTPHLRFFMIGWTQTGSDVLIASSAPWDNKLGASLIAVGADSGAQRVLYESPDQPLFSLGASPSSGWKVVPFVLHGDLTLVDTATGQAQVISKRTSYFSPVVSDDAARLVYAVYTGARESTESEIHLRDMATGSDRVLATVPGAAQRICPSPSWDRLFVSRQRLAPGDLPPLMVGLDGRIQELVSGNSCLGWHGRDHVVVTRGHDSGWLGLTDVTTGETRTLFPQ